MATTIRDTLREAVGPHRREGRAGPRWIAVALLTAFALAFVLYKAFTRPDDAGGLPGHESSSTYTGFDPGASPGSNPNAAPPAAPGSSGD